MLTFILTKKMISVASNYDYTVSLDAINLPLVLGWVEGKNWKSHKTSYRNTYSMKNENSFQRCSQNHKEKEMFRGLTFIITT